ncbi:MAG: diadenylate cyclase CdaA [Bacteroidales bacterium]|nr:diadenylate cyclase CdaA [Bacteroidales bacterium]
MVTLIAGLHSIRFVDIIDILLVAALFFYLYRLVRGTNVIRIFWAILVIVIARQIAYFLNMRLSGALLGEIVSVGLVALVIIFQPEIRKFLLLVGTKTTLAGDSFKKRFLFWKHNISQSSTLNVEPYIQACMHMSQSKTGALIIFKRQNELDDIIATGERIDATTSAALLEALFFKNSPLHDGAVIVRKNTILAARCILPVSSNPAIDANLGLRHRSAIGISEQIDVISVVVSEETGAISYVVDGEIHHDVSPVELRQFLEKNIS